MRGILRKMLNKSRSSPKHYRRMKLNLETEFCSAPDAETKHQDSEFVRRCVRSMRMALHWGVFISSGGICLILWCNISRRSKEAVGLKEERDCELKSTSHSSHASMSTHINIYFIMKIIRENYKRFPRSHTQAIYLIRQTLFGKKEEHLCRGTSGHSYLWITGPSRGAFAFRFAQRDGRWGGGRPELY